MQNDSMPLVSVVIPCYNTELYIADAINSVLAQTYPAIEVIVVDDGSTDNSAAIIKNFSQYANLRYIYQQNGGVCRARNTGIGLAAGSIIALLDADDWMYPDNIHDKMIALQQQQADMVYSYAEVTNERLEKQYIGYGADPKNFAEEVFVFAPPPVHSPSSVVVKKKALLDAGLFDPQLGTSADLDMWIRLSLHAKVTRVEKPLIQYRLVPGSMNTNITGQIKDMNFIFQKYGTDKSLHRQLKKLKKGFYYSIAGNAYHTKNIRRLVTYLLKYMAVSF